MISLKIEKKCERQPIRKSYRISFSELFLVEEKNSNEETG